METIVYIALGSNQGDRAKNISDAIALLRKSRAIRVISVSRSLENPAVDGPAGSPDFLNAVAEIRTSLRPADLLAQLLQTETQLGRVRSERNAPRTIDLDILLFGDEILDETHLKVPHPRMHERRFVLEPLAQIAPHLIHPILHRSITDLLSIL